MRLRYNPRKGWFWAHPASKPRPNGAELRLWFGPYRNARAAVMDRLQLA